MILVLWLARSLDWLVLRGGIAANAVYRVHFRHENRKALRDERRAAIERVINESRPAIDRLRRLHVRAPIPRDR
jgi:hypothetical protein